jgi:hypothetical protein
MLHTTEDMLNDATSPIARLNVWLKIGADLPINIARQQLMDARMYGFGNAPHYLRNCTFLAAILLMPFFAALSANGLDKVLFNSTLQNSWVWHRPIIGLWILYFPLMASLLILSSYVAYIIRNEGGVKLFRSRLFNIHMLWVTLMVGFIAIGILSVVIFHDSGQCWMHSPQYDVTHFKHALRCTGGNAVSAPIVFKRSI